MKGVCQNEKRDTISLRFIKQSLKLQNRKKTIMENEENNILKELDQIFVCTLLLTRSRLGLLLVIFRKFITDLMALYRCQIFI